MAFVMIFFALLMFDCGYAQNTLSICCDGTVRLAGGPLPNEGRVEVCVSGQWKTVCDNNWSMNEAQVVCRQLGYYNSQAADVVPLTRASHGQGTGMIVEQIRCNGAERRLTDCTVRDEGDGECSHNEDAGVICSCRSGDVRLQGSNVQGRGRVEVCVDNVWGTVCDNSWSTSDASVVCKQLGFSRYGAQARCCAADGQGAGPVHMDNVRCVGDESLLTDCVHSSQHSCHHSEDASVQCRTNIVCYDGDVRLVNGSRPHVGRVEVCFNERWGTVCDDYIGNGDWNTSEADVVCRQLGYSGAYASTRQFGNGSVPAIIAHVGCKGHESSLAECAYSTRHYYLEDCHFHDRFYYHNPVGVQCKPDNIENGKFRISSGLTQFEGRVEIYWNSKWRAICSEGWDERDATVVCRQLNYLATSLEVKAISHRGSVFKSRTSVLLTDVRCNGTERSITKCCAKEITNSSHCHSTAGVRCAQCTENSIRLVGELSRNEGFLLICLGGTWGKVCGNRYFYITSSEAVVACRQLGFSTQAPGYYSYDRSRSRYYFGWTYSPNLPTVLNIVGCVGNENSLLQCNHYERPRKYCETPVGVKCQNSNETVPGVPQNIIMSNVSSSSIFLSWSPPLMSDRYGLAIFNYTAKCSAEAYQLENTVSITDRLNTTFSNLHPFSSYNCCVAANSVNGRGEQACLRIITAPNDVPTRLQANLINSTSISLTWYPPDEECTNNYTPKQYRVEVIGTDTGHTSYTVFGTTHLQLNNLQLNHQYRFRVAAYTDGLGPFSEPLMVTSSPLQEHCTNNNYYFENESTNTVSAASLSINVTGLVTSLALFFALVFIAFFVTLTVLIVMCRRYQKQLKKVIRQPPQDQTPVYEIINVCSNIEGPAYNAVKETDPYQQQLQISSTPQEYLSPVSSTSQPVLLTHAHIENPVQAEGTPGDNSTTVKDEKNIYQPLQPKVQTGSDESEYQSLTHRTMQPTTQPSEVPPALPPKPGTKVFY